MEFKYVQDYVKQKNGKAIGLPTLGKINNRSQKSINLFAIQNVPNKLLLQTFNGSFYLLSKEDWNNTMLRIEELKKDQSLDLIKVEHYSKPNLRLSPYIAAIRFYLEQEMT